MSAWANTATFSVQAALEAWDRSKDPAALEEAQTGALALLAAVEVLRSKS